MRRSTKKRISAVILYAAGVLVTLVMVSPLVWLISTSLRPLAETVTSPPTIIPSTFTIGAYFKIWETAPFLSYVMNSLVVALWSTVFVLFFSSLAAYGLRRFQFRHERLIITIILGSQALPGAALVIPVFKMFVNFGLVDTRFGLVILYTGFLTPFCTWLLYGYFRSVPMELMESAAIDGMNHVQVLFRIVVPLAAPAIIATAAFAFLNSWNEFVFALILSRDNAMTVPVGLFSKYFSRYVNLWDQVAAGSVFVSLPPVILFFIVQNQMVSGLTKGAVKG